MTQWIQTSDNTRRSILLDGTGIRVYFSDTGKAEVSDFVAAALVDGFPDISLTDGTNPGSALGSGDYTDEVYKLPDGTKERIVSATGKFTSVDATNYKSRGNAIQGRISGMVVPVADGLGIFDAIDPSSSTTPVQDAIDIVSSAGGGQVLLPPKTISEDGPIVPANNVSIIGCGRGVSKIQVATSGINGIQISDNDFRKATIEGFSIIGQGDTSTEAHAFDLTRDGSMVDVIWRDIHIEGWYGNGLNVNPNGTSGGMFQCRFESIRFQNIDAGDHDAIMNFRRGVGPQISMSAIVAYPSDSTSNADSTVLLLGQGQFTIDTLSIGGSPKYAIDQIGGAEFSIDRIHYEPFAKNDQSHAMIELTYDTLVDIGQVRLVNGTVNYIYNLTGSPGHYRLGTMNGNGTVNTKIVRVGSAPVAPITYHGVSGDIADIASAGTNLVVSLGDLTKSC